MDPFAAFTVFLILLIGIPLIILYLRLNVYLEVLGLSAIAVLSYFWLLHKLAPSPSKSRQDAATGLHKIYPKTADPAEEPKPPAYTDVVFVHGLGANPGTAWNFGDSCWITDFLPDDLKKDNLQSCVRFHTFSYHSWWVQRSNTEELRNTGRSLRQELQRLKSDLILVGHSYGGLVVKQALVLSLDLKHRLKGVIFLGTPHEGTPYSRLGIRGAQLLSPMGSDVEIMKGLIYGRGELKNLQRDFLNNFKDVPRKYFYEKQKIYLYLFGFIPMVQEKLVPEESAAAGADCDDDIIGLDADHSGLNRFEDRSDNYHKVVRELIPMIKKDAPKNGKRTTIMNPHNLAPQNPHNQEFTSPESTPRNVCFTVPFKRDPKFVDRDGIIEEIDRRFEGHSRVAISGIGGVGKSQIAIEYCYRFQKQHHNAHIFWVYASSGSRMDQGYKRIAEDLSLPGWNSADVDTFKLVSRALSSSELGHWLLVLDNVDEQGTLFDIKENPSSMGNSQKEPLINHLPSSSTGLTLITTRDNSLGMLLSDDSKTTKVLPMTLPDAEFLLRSKLSPECNCDSTKSHELVEVLECLPLAITQAAAYIEHNEITIEKYLDILHADENEMGKLMEVELRDIRRDGESGNSVIRTWKLSFDKIKEKWQRAAEILCLMAVLDRQGIPETLLKKQGESEGLFIDSLGKLKAFSLVSTTKNGDTLGIHRLVQLATRMWLDLHGGTAKWQEEALKSLAATFPFGDHKNWSSCQVLSPHAQTVIRYDFQPDVDLIRAVLLHNMATYDESRGHYNFAFGRVSEALSIRTRVLSLENADTLISLYYVARVLWRQGKYKEAEEKHRQTLELRKKVLGPEHQHTLWSMNNLGILCFYQGKYGAAADIHQRTLKLHKKVLGPEHPDTLESMSNLAASLRRLGQYNTAVEIHRQTLELRKKVVGPEHPDTLISMNNLAVSLHSLQKFDAAMEIHQQTLELRKKVVGPEHPDTLVSMNNLAVSLLFLGKGDTAVEIHQQTIELRKKVLGPEHPDTLLSINNLEDTLPLLRKGDAATEIRQRTPGLRKKVLGPEHLDTLVSMKSIVDTPTPATQGHQGQQHASVGS